MVTCIAKLLISRFVIATPLPLRNARGFSLPPKHSHEKFFRKFFQITPRRLFADFLARICDEESSFFRPAGGGGTPFCGLVGLSLPFFRSSIAPALSLVAFPLSLWASVPDWLTASGALWHHRGSWSCCVPRFVGWCVAPLPRSCLGPGFPREHQDLQQQVQKGAKGAKKGQKLRFLWSALVFPRDFAIPQQGKN